MTYSRANTTESDVDLIEKEAGPFYSKLKGLEYSVRLLRSSIGCLWVVDHQTGAFLHETFQLPGDERDLFFSKMGFTCQFGHFMGYTKVKV